MSDSQLMVRQWLILKTLASRTPGVTVAELANEFHVSLKTVRRDLDVLRMAGFPLEETAGEFNRKSWRLQPTAAKFDLVFQYDEALALSFSQRFLEPLAGTYFGDAVQRAFRKIRASVGKNVLRYLDKMSSVLQQTMRGVGDYSRKAEIIDELMVGIEDQKVVMITYQSAQATEPATYAIHPYGLMYHRGSLYLVGFAPRHGALRHWKIDRVVSAERRDSPFERPEEFDLQKHFADSFGIYHGDQQIKVRIRFAPSVARFVTESTWHPSQQLTPQPDGGLLAEFELSSTVEIKSWALSFGAAAEVLEPAELRTEIADDLITMMKKYNAGSAQPSTPGKGEFISGGIGGGISGGKQPVARMKSPPQKER